MVKQRIFIFLLVGIMLFGVFGTGILLLSNRDDSVSSAVDGEVTGGSCGPEGSPQPFKPSGDVKELGITDLEQGTGKVAQAGDVITVHYCGNLATTGEVFESSFQQGDPANFPLQGLITGWQEGIPGMAENGVRRLVIPSDKAYGPSGSGTIPPNADLVFTIKLLKVEKL